MDIAAYNNDINGDERQLQSINACQLYHRLVFPSDMLNYTRQTMKNICLWGNRSMRTKRQKILANTANTSRNTVDYMATINKEKVSQ